ncbi:TPA: hypothetical protein I3816_004447 [Enterobacter cloacae]|uniref:hypothetical protein n=1 Tax=Enterobacter cloacae TaxID=550 RepID=UPI000668F401|nr:hypothetical protein [Enterobacter cloacae]HAS1008503.1 hypothetical protein [Enterobacter cloacae]HAS1148267.1 hypothetical protein [Enterobacter cloacae]HAS1180205.1 hypothetical protein [Enterobacter cloacae]HAS1199690.1 hypothetical protein [Enterobacter cloacae]
MMNQKYYDVIVNTVGNPVGQYESIINYDPDGFVLEYLKDIYVSVNRRWIGVNKGWNELSNVIHMGMPEEYYQDKIWNSNYSDEEKQLIGKVILALIDVWNEEKA